MASVRTALLAVCVSLIASTLIAAPAGSEPEPEPEPGTPYYQFVSTPDFLNADIGDLRTWAGWDRFARDWTRRYPHLPVPNSWNADWAQYVDQYLSTMKAEPGSDVLVAGDMVNGRWNRDEYLRPNGTMTRTRLFGEVYGTDAQRITAVGRAALFYFWRNRNMFEKRGMRLLTAPGDHEFLDNPWRDNATGHTKRELFPVIREMYRRAFIDNRGLGDRPAGYANNTAYATYLHPEVLLVSLDQFLRKEDRTLMSIGANQTEWLDGVLTEANAAGIDWIIVQGHTPIVPTVAWSNSSRLCYEGGASSALWTLLEQHQVDLYFNGEVHDDSRVQIGGVTQIAHGGAAPGLASWLQGNVYDDRMELTLKAFPRHVTDPGSPRLFDVSGTGPIANFTLDATPRVLGEITLTKDQQITHSTGPLVEYAGDQQCNPEAAYRQAIETR